MREFRIKSICLLIFSLGLISSIVPAFATNWYVDSARGSDTTNTGTSLLSPYATLQKAANMTAAGDTVYVLPGSGYGGGTSGTAPLIISTSGTGGGTIAGGSCTSPITYTAFPGTRPIITGTRSTTGVIVGAYPLSCIVINGFELAGWNPSLTWSGASANAVAGTALTNGNYNSDGIFIAGGTSSHILHHIVVTNNYVHDFPLGGIDLNYTDYVTISGNVTSGNGLYSPFAGSGISLYESHNIDSGTGTKNIISGNKSFNNINYIPNYTGKISLTTSAASSTGSSQLTFSSTSSANYTMAVIDGAGGCIPPGDIVYYFTGSTIINLTTPITCPIASGDVLQLGYITDGEGIIIDNNSNSQSDSIPYIGRTLVTNNIVFNNGNSGLEAAPLSNHIDVNYNDSYLNQVSPAIAGSSGAAGEISDSGTTDSTFCNNIFVANSTVPSVWDQSTSNTTFGNNLIFGGNASHTLPGVNNVTLSPQFVSPGTTIISNFKLGPTSPAIGAANGSVYSRLTDFAGGAGSTNGSFDIGAFQTQNCSLAGTPNLKTLGPLISEFTISGAGLRSQGSIRDLINTLYCTAQ